MTSTTAAVLHEPGDLRIESIEIPPRVEAVNTYPIVLVEDASDPEAGREFIEHGLQALGDELARAVDVHIVMEDHCDLREAELGE